ncbi:MAG: IPT/TIG domain-containing protein [Acidobacteriia bacterium]|nr:IPT/TIG domain-containing protein [Terriglobia bacterium]
MRISLLSIPLLLAVAAPANPQPQSGMPLMSSVEPASGKVGDVVAIQGVNLGQDIVAELYLTDGKTDLKVAMIEQTSTSIKFRIPPEAKPGRLALMVLTRGKDRKLIEQPVKIEVEPDTAGPTGS